MQPKKSINLLLSGCKRVWGQQIVRCITFLKKATTALAPFEALHGRQPNTILRNLTKIPSLQNLNWSNILKQKCLCLDKNDSEMNAIAYPRHSTLEERSDLEFALTLRKASLIIDSKWK